MNFGSHLDATVLLAVELVNELTGGWARGRPYPTPEREQSKERVLAVMRARPSRLREWRQAPPAQTVQLMRIAWRLRSVFEAVDRRDLDTGAATLNELMGEHEARPELSRHDGEPWHLHFHARSAEPAQGVASSCATALAMVVGSDAASRLGVCGADNCDRVFVDASRNGTRRFCSTACQNRAKAAAFRARRSAP